MGDEDKPVSSNADLEEPGNLHDAEGDSGGADRPTGGKKAAGDTRVGQQPDKMRERGTVDPDKPDPSGGPT